ncbi:MAG: sigma-70 family RNA polymerase sigma factor [Saprospiraceae bacterium]|nr:sigma-70 family RNA polymerase sigma factor [Saprospiraceae bacterium]
MEKDLLTLCLKDDLKAQNKLYDLYKVSMFVLCQRYFSQRDDAQDALQEGFVKVYRDLYQYDSSKGTLGSWMKRVFINTCLEILRKKRIDFNNLDDIGEIPYQDAGVISDLNHKDLTRLIQKLPAGYRTVFNLYIIEGYTHGEIAEKLNISENTSKTQLMKAKIALKRSLELIF